MESVFILIPISIILVFVIGGFFWWSSKNGQFDDLEGPAHRILLDDDSPQVTDNPQKMWIPPHTATSPQTSLNIALTGRSYQ